MRIGDRLAMLATVWIGGAACTSAGADPPRACEPDRELDTGNRRTTMYFHDTVLGKTAEELVKKYGEPMCQSKAKWRYVLPPGCHDEKTLVTLWFSGKKVVRVNAIQRHTGELCR